MKEEILGKHYCNGDGKFRNVVRITGNLIRQDGSLVRTESWIELEGYPFSEMETAYSAQ